jgi:hypothetical protein
MWPYSLVGISTQEETVPNRVGSEGRTTPALHSTLLASRGAQRKPLQMDLDCSTKTTRLMSWLERKTAAPEWCGGVVPAKAEA